MSDPTSSANPYAAPQHAQEGQLVAIHQGMSLLRGFGIVCVSGVAGMVVGALFGLFIGTFFPDYYRAVFGNTQVSPLQVGVALGLTQGGGIGLAVGCVVMLGVAISIRRIGGK